MTSAWAEFELTTLVVIGIHCKGSLKSNNHIITTMTVPKLDWSAILNLYYWLWLQVKIFETRKCSEVKDLTLFPSAMVFAKTYFTFLPSRAANRQIHSEYFNHCYKANRNTTKSILLALTAGKNLI
jgi:hypothetical protein